MSDMLADWLSRPLSDVAEVIRGVTYKGSDASTVTGPGLVPLLRATNIDNGKLNLDSDLVFVPEHYVKPHQRLREGDIVVAASSGSIEVVGKSAALRGSWNGTFGAFCAAIRPTNVEPRFLLHYLHSQAVRERWSSAARGTNINNLKRSDLLTTPVPVPSPEEQRRTIEILEDHLSRLDAAAEAMKSASRRSAALRDVRLRQLFVIPGAAESTLGDVASWGSGGTPRARTPMYYSGGTIPWVVSGDLDDAPLARVSGRITEAGLKSSSAKWVEPGSVLVAMYGATIGKLAIATERVTTNQAVAHARPDQSRTTSSYLFWYLRGQRARLVAAGQGGAQPNISQTILKQWRVPLPSLDEQHRIVAAATELFAEAADLDRAMLVARQRSSALRRALLRAAFDGSLALSDPHERTEATLG